MKNVSDKRCRENKKTHFVANKLSFKKTIVPFRDYVKKKYCTAVQATDDNQHAHYMLYTQGYKHTHTQVV